MMLSAKYNAVMNASKAAAALGRRGGIARARRLSAVERRRIASLGGLARRRSLEAARRIQRNLEYAAVVVVLGGHVRQVKRVDRVTGRLPGIYPERS
jgi:hypothetical protein